MYLYMHVKAAMALFFMQPTARPTPSESPASYVDLEEIAKKERQRIEELLKAKGIRYGSYPRFTLAIKGQKVIDQSPFSMATFLIVHYICLALSAHLIVIFSRVF